MNCFVCGEFVEPIKVNLWRHFDRAHQLQKTDEFTCTFDGCGKKYSSYNSFAKHATIHFPQESDCAPVLKQAKYSTRLEQSLFTSVDGSKSPQTNTNSFESRTFSNIDSSNDCSQIPNSYQLLQSQSLYKICIRQRNQTGPFRMRENCRAN